MDTEKCVLHLNKRKISFCSRKFKLYFTQYVSPNIVIVPTVSFSSSSTGHKPETIVSNRVLNVEQTVENNFYISPASNCINKQNSGAVVNTTPRTIKSTADFSKNLPLATQDIVSTNDPTRSMHPSTKDITPSKYKSRNNLVDLTGFNILKRDCKTSAKRNDFKPNSEIKSDHDLNKTTDKKENVKHVDNTTSQKENKSNKESSKKSTEKPVASRSKENAKNSTSRSKESTTEMEEKMKKYFRHLWNRNLEKLKEKSGKDRRDRDIKSSTTEKPCKSLKLESCKSKPKLQKVSKTTPAKRTKYKLNVQETIQNQDHDRKNISDIKKLQRKGSSKSETKTCHSYDSKPITKNHEPFLSPVSIKRYKDFQHFINNNNDNIKRDSEKQTKTEEAQVKKKLLGSGKSTTISSLPKKKLTERKQAVKDHTKTCTKDKTEKVYTVESIKKADKPLNNDSFHSRGSNERQDLRSKLSRKRTRSQSSQQVLTNKLDHENLVVTLKQDLKPDPKIMPKLAPNLNTPKTKKFKKIKLVINIVCPNSDSDSDHEHSASPQDLSFLDDFNIDEIVDSLKTNPIENNQINETEISHLINNRNVTDITNIINESRPKERLINDLNIKAIKIKTEETDLRDERVIVINSDTEDEDIEVIAITDNVNNNDGIKLKTVSKPNNNKEDISYVKELTKTSIKTNVQDVLMDLCDESSDSVQEIKYSPIKNNHTDTQITCQETSELLSTKFDRPSTTINKTAENANYVKNIRKAAISEIKKVNPNKKINLFLQSLDNTSTSSIEVVKHSKENVTRNIECLNMKPEIKDHTVNSADPIELSLESLFSNTEQKTNNKLDIEISELDKHVKDEKSFLQNSGYSVEASLETMFKHINQECKTNLNNGFTDTSDQYIKKEIEQQSQKVSKESSKCIKQTSDVNNIQLKLFNKLDETINQQLECSNKSVPKVQIIQKPMKNNILTEANIKLNKIQLKSKYSPVSKEIINKSIEKKTVTIMSSEPSQESFKVKPEKVSLNNDSRSTRSLEILRNTENEKCDLQGISLKISAKHIPEKPDKLQKPQALTIGFDKRKMKDSNMPITSHSCDKDINNKPGNCLIKTIIMATEKSNEIVKDVPLRHSESTKYCEPINNNTENNCDNHSYVNMPDKYLKEKENSQVSKDTLKEFLVPKSNNASNVEILTDTQMDIVTSNKNCDQSAEDVLKSTIMFKTPIHNSEKNVTILVNSNIPHDKVNEKDELQLHGSGNTPKIEHKHSENMIVEKKTKIELDVDSNKLTEEKADKNIQDTIVTTDNSLSTSNNNIIHYANGNIHLESLTNTNNNEGEHPLKEGAPKAVSITIKSNPEENQVESPETDSNDIRKSKTTADTTTKIEDSSKDSTKKDSETHKLDEPNIETSAKFNQQQINSNEDMVSNGIEKNDGNIQKDETKSKQFELILPSKFKPFVEKLEARMFQYLDNKYTVTSLLHNGNFSIIYKCRNVQGENYAIKVYNVQWIGVCVERMLSKLKKKKLNDNPCLLHLINGFEVLGQWCLLSEYYPLNLEEALNVKRKSLHIDVVQVLSRQLVEAVNMLTNNNIIHSDIKPSHVLLNSELNKLKLTGFDRAYYSGRIKISPRTSTSSYRAPEIILGFSAGHKIDVWSTALVMFEMATKTQLFPGLYNNDILYKQLCTLKSFDWDMVENSKFKNKYFVGTSFLRQVGRYGQKTQIIHVIQRNDNLRSKIFSSYNLHWARYRTRWQSTEDLDKLESLHKLLEQMLAMDPRHRLPIQFVSASEFIHDGSS